MIVDDLGWPAGAASVSLIVLSLGLARWARLGVGREIVVASIRAAVQLLAVGSVFAIMFTSADAAIWAWSWVAFMIIVGSIVVLRRARERIGRLAVVVSCAVLGSTAISLAVIFGFSVIDYEPISLVVIAGITIGNAVPVTVLGVNQSIDMCRDRIGELDATLSLGFDREDIVRFMAPRAAGAALTPQIERTKVVGLIALPGAMTGLLLGGVDPMDAVIVQLIVMYLVLGSAAVCIVSVVVAVTWASVTRDLQVADWVRWPVGRPAGRPTGRSGDASPRLSTRVVESVRAVLLRSPVRRR